MSEVARKWKGRIAGSERVCKAGDLYCGRSMREIHLGVRSLKADLWIASAGLGFDFQWKQKIPAYSLNECWQWIGFYPSKNRSGRLVLRLVGGNMLKSMGVGISSLRKLLGRQKQTLCLVALPEAYAKLMMDDFLKLNPSQRSRIRLFGMSLASVMPADFHPYIMPYDDRLDGLQ